MAVIDNDPGTEAERLSEWHDADWGAESMAQVYREEQEARAVSAAARYAAAKAAKTGESVPCGFCARPFKKTSYQQAFCCNKGSGNCKDAYWNRMNPRGIYG